MWEREDEEEALFSVNSSLFRNDALYRKRRLQLKRQKESPSFRKRYISLRVKLLKRRQFGDGTDLLSLRNLSLCDESSTTKSSFSGVERIYDFHSDSVSQIAFGKNILVSSSLDGTLRIIDSLQSDIARILIEKASILSFDISESDEFLVSSFSDCSLVLWDISSGNILRRIVDSQRIMNVRFLPLNINFIVCVFVNSSVQMFNISTGKFISCSPILGHPTAVEINKLGNLLWVGNSSGIVESFKIDNGKISKGCRLHLHKSVSSLTCNNGILYVHLADCPTFDFYRIVDDFGSLVPYKRIPLNSWPPLRCLAIARGDNLLIGGNQDGSLSLFDLTREIQINSLHGHLNPVISLGFSLNESLLASGDSSGQIIIWKKS